MAIYRVLRQHVLSERDFVVRGTEIARSFLRAESSMEGARVSFAPVGKGLPLTVMIRHVYTGRFPEPGFLGGGDGDVAVVSGVRDFDVFNACARALNFVAKDQRPGSHLRGPSAFSEGTGVVTYSPAVLADSITLTIELAVATFPDKLVAALSSAFTTLAGLPILMPSAGYLLGAGKLLKIGGELGAALLDGPVFSITDPLNFDVPGSPQVDADFRVLANKSLEADRYEYRDGVGLVDRKTDKPYDGDEPYVVVSLDGHEKKELEKFAPTVASAAVLQRFFQVKEGQQAAIDTLIEGLQVASDLKYRKRATDLQSEIKELPDGSEKKAALQKELDSVLKNIITDTLRLKDVDSRLHTNSA